ncbi:hypothetical protein HDU83_002896 [Entophlyctis luteolus]|nr:hypothetical protein HDU83_002896 [Entophlyctis luteolus]
MSAANAAAFLSKSRLPQNVLGEIWGLCDSDQNGFLSQANFYKCLKLIALYQAGKPVSLQFLNSNTPLPVFDGFAVPTPSAAPPAPKMLAPQMTGSTLSRGGSSPGFQLSIEEKERFHSAFKACQPNNGFVTGNIECVLQLVCLIQGLGASSKELFLKSGLSTEILSRIWSLVDPHGTNQLNLTQFMLAMLIITQMKTGALQVVPQTIPPPLMSAIASAAASVSQPSNGVSPTTLNTSSEGSTMSGPRSVVTAPTIDRRRSVMARSPTGDFSAPIWAITADEKALSDTHFDELDSGKKGYLTGQDSYSFFLRSQLNQTVLAQVWDLASVTKSPLGLSRDEFSVAMHLIKLAMSGQTLPETLPPSLVPPSLRSSSQSQKIAAPLVPAPAAIPTPSLPAPPKSTATQDLMSLGEIQFEKPPVPTSPTGFGSLPKSFALASTASPAAGSAPSLPADDLGRARAQLAQLQSQRDVLTPAHEQLRARQAAADAEYATVLQEKQALTLELARLTAQYEAEREILRENEGLYMREAATTEQLRLDVAEAAKVVDAVAEERRRVEAAIAAVVEEQSECRQRVAEMETRISSMRAEIEVMRPKFVEAHKDLKSQMNLVEINAQLLASVGDEYKTLKNDLARDTEELEIARAKVVQLANQVAVQSAINDRERTRLQQASQSLNEVRAASLSQLDTLNSLEKDGTTPANAQQPLSQTVTKSTGTIGRPKPPPPPSALEKRRSKEPSAADTPSPVLSQIPAAIGIPPPPLPSRTTKPKIGSSLGSLGSVAETDVLKLQPSTAATAEAVPGSNFAFDADFDSVFSTAVTSNGVNFDDAFSVPTGAANAANDTKKVFDDLFSSFPATPSTPATVPEGSSSIADVFGVQAKPLSVSAFASSPPSVSQTASGEGFNKFKIALAGPGSAGAFADSTSVRSGSGSSHPRRRMTKLMTVDLDSELANAFGTTDGASKETDKGGDTGATVSTPAATVAVAVDAGVQSVAAIVPVTSPLADTPAAFDAFSFDDAQPGAPAPAVVPSVDDSSKALSAFVETVAENPAGTGPAGETVLLAGDINFLEASGASSAPAAALAGIAEVTAAASGEAVEKFDGFSSLVSDGADVPASQKPLAPDVIDHAIVSEISETKLEAASAVEGNVEATQIKPEAMVSVVSELKQVPVVVQTQVDVSSGEKVDATQQDDLEEVKNLIGMGFTRDQSVEALERNGFDTEKALNELLPK